ncbi:MAG: 4'-phosphopantetheinyl transferase superfamily protein [Ferruginibacter sp.]
MDKNKAVPQWQQATPGRLICLNQVHVWRASIDLTEVAIQKLLQILSADEVEKANRFHFQKDKKRFIAARGILRQILGGYTGTSPDKLRFNYTANGKPVLATNTDTDTLKFNLSHSGSFALYGFSLHQNIGIDIECIRHDISAVQIAQKFFSKKEISLLGQVDNDKFHQLFFQLWTRKEAILKANGEGISSSMEKIDVSLINGRGLSAVTLPSDESEGMRWYVQDLFPDHGFSGAIAVEEGLTEIYYLHYSR